MSLTRDWYDKKNSIVKNNTTKNLYIFYIIANCCQWQEDDFYTTILCLDEFTPISQYYHKVSLDLITRSNLPGCRQLEKWQVYTHQMRLQIIQFYLFSNGFVPI